MHVLYENNIFQHQMPSEKTCKTKMHSDLQFEIFIRQKKKKKRSQLTIDRCLSRTIYYINKIKLNEQNCYSNVKKFNAALFMYDVVIIYIKQNKFSIESHYKHY